MSDWTVGKFIAALLALIFYFSGSFIGFPIFIISIILIWVVISVVIALLSDAERAYEKFLAFLSALLLPVIALADVPSKNSSFKCPRCDGSDHYSSREQISSGAVGGLIDNPDGPDFGIMRPVSYGTYVKRCKNCNTQMYEHLDTDYYVWRERWYNVTYFAFCFSILFIGMEIVLPWALEI